MPTVEKYNKWIESMFKGLAPCSPYDFKDKEAGGWTHSMYMLGRTQSMFKWSGLPESIPQRMVELYLQVNGNVAFYQYEGAMYVFRGGLGGEPDVYYMPTIYTIANPALNLSKNLKIGEDCVVVSNDSLYLGLMPLYNRYASMMAESELSLWIAAVNSRIVDLITAPDDRTKASAEKFLDDVLDGKLGVISSNEFFEGLKALPYSTAGARDTITNLIELIQYIKASWYNDLGINANYNMKRESINTEESQLNHDALFPLVDDMLRCRQEGAERVNEMFGTEITVELASSWQDNKEEIDLEQQMMAAKAEDPEEPAEDPEDDPEEPEEGDEDE